MTTSDRKHYESIDACNWSTLKYARESMLLYRHAVDNPREDNTGLMMGRATHTAVFMPQRLDIDYVVFDGDRRGNAWKEFKAAHAGLTILRRDEMEQVKATAAAVLAHPIAREWLNLDMALIERPIVWTDPYSKLKCKGIPDLVHSAIVDLKGMPTVDERLATSQATRSGWIHQAAFYRRGYRELTKLWLPCAILAVEFDAPHDVAVFPIDEDSLRVADDEITRMLARVAECKKAGAWPGRYDTARTMSLPPWAREPESFDFDDVEAA